MNLEPQKFFIGVVDFFSVLMPGALLSYTLRYLRVLLLGPDSLGEAQGWLMFFFSSYLLGHFIFLIGSWLDLISNDPLHSFEQLGLSAARIVRHQRSSARPSPSNRSVG
jgi:hypothetical protein